MFVSASCISHCCRYELSTGLATPFSVDYYPQLPADQLWVLIASSEAFDLVRVRQVTTVGPGKWSEPLYPAVVEPTSAPSSPADNAVYLPVIVGILATLIAVISIIIALVVRKRHQRHKTVHLGIPLKDHWELVPLHIALGTQIGSGAFGKVFKGILATRYGRTEEVAVKVCYTGAAVAEKRAFLDEAATLKHICEQPHPNVARLVGVCLQAQPFWIVQEYLAMGDLKTYLQTQLYSPEQLPGPQLRLLESVRIIRDVLSAMEHLSSLGFVHRDLAARNVLLAADLTAKVTDFGLTRQLSELQAMQFLPGSSTSEETLPVRWMAPEVLQQSDYSLLSDVWSMGVLVWEVFQFGEMPYPSMNNEEVLEEVLHGYRLAQPDRCPDDIWAMALSCWSPLIERPSFGELHEFANELLQRVSLLGVMDPLPSSQRLSSVDSADFELPISRHATFKASMTAPEYTTIHIGIGSDGPGPAQPEPSSDASQMDSKSTRRGRPSLMNLQMSESLRRLCSDPHPHVGHRRSSSLSQIDDDVATGSAQQDRVQDHEVHGAHFSRGASTPGYTQIRLHTAPLS